MGHWRQMMDSPYLGVWDIPEDNDGKPRDVIATIKRVEAGEVTSTQGNAKKPIIYFDGQKKGLIANVTNCKTIARLYGDDPREWTGRQVTLYAGETSVKGETVRCVRIRQQAPKPQQVEAAAKAQGEKK